MNRFVALVKVAFLQLLSGIKSPGRKRGKGSTTSGAGALAFLVFIALYISVAYSMMFASILEQTGKLNLLIFMMSVVTAIMSLMLTAFSAGGLLFGGKDADLLLSLPVSAFEVMLSKTLALYLENAALALFMMLPAGIIYMIKAGAFLPLFLVTLVLSSLVLALFTTLCAFVIGFILSWLGAKTKGSKLMSNLLYFAFFAGVMYFSFRINNIASAFASSAGDLSESSGVMWIFAAFSRAVFGDIGSFALLFLAAAAPFFAVVWLLSARYKRVINAISGVKTRGDYKLSGVKSRSQFSALVRKESERYFGTTLYLFNTGFGLVLLLAGAAVALIKRADINAFISSAGLGEFPGGAVSILAALVCFLVSTSCSASISISLERDRLWILKESPVETMSIFHAKAGFNILVNACALLVACPLLGIALGLPALDVAAVLVLALALSVFMAYAGLLVNLRYPKLDALNDTVIIKQSLAAMLPVLIGMAAVAAGAGLYSALLARVLSFWTFALLCAALLAGLTALCIRLLAGWGSRRFAQL